MLGNGVVVHSHNAKMCKGFMVPLHHVVNHIQRHNNIPWNSILGLILNDFCVANGGSVTGIGFGQHGCLKGLILVLVFCNKRKRDGA